jgi:hypothetical protein
MILEPSDPSSSTVLSLKETFDWHIDEGNHCQILFLTPKSKVKADVILWFNHLSELVKDRRHNKQIQPELLCSVRYNIETKSLIHH